MDRDTHVYHYLILIFGLLASFFFFLFFRQNPSYQIISALGGCVFYSIWGILHGLLEERLNLHIALEYITLSLFVFALFFVSLSLK